MKLDCIIILSNVNPEIAKKRVEKGIEIYEKERAKIIMSGGFALSHKKDPGFREANLMKDYAVELGIPARDIFVEDESRDTQGNAYFSKQIVKANPWKRIAVVTSDFHIPKAKFFFDFIFGEKYDIRYFCIENNYSDEELKKIADEERKSVEVMIDLYREKRIKRGDDEKVGVLLKKFYASR